MDADFTVSDEEMVLQDRETEDAPAQAEPAKKTELDLNLEDWWAHYCHKHPQPQHTLPAAELHGPADDAQGRQNRWQSWMRTAVAHKQQARKVPHHPHHHHPQQLRHRLPQQHRPRQLQRRPPPQRRWVPVHPEQAPEQQQPQQQQSQHSMRFPNPVGAGKMAARAVPQQHHQQQQQMRDHFGNQPPVGAHPGMTFGNHVLLQCHHRPQPLQPMFEEKMHKSQGMTVRNHVLLQRHHRPSPQQPMFEKKMHKSQLMVGPYEWKLRQAMAQKRQQQQQQQLHPESDHRPAAHTGANDRLRAQQQHQQHQQQTSKDKAIEVITEVLKRLQQEPHGL